jgi:hypothetical protein
MPPSNRAVGDRKHHAQPADPRLLSNRHHSTLRSGLGVRESQRNLILAVHLIFGLIVLAAGFGVMSGRLARWLGIIFVSIQALTNFLFIPAQPFWAIILILMTCGSFITLVRSPA